MQRLLTHSLTHMAHVQIYGVIKYCLCTEYCVYVCVCVCARVRAHACVHMCVWIKSISARPAPIMLA